MSDALGLPAVLDHVFWGIGAIFSGVVVLLGVSVSLMWLADKLIKHLGLWPDFFRVLRRMYRERRDAANG
ncbi:hypothetical protein [Roseomonas xinghualingensis]|uniref:hypothetical protein n=1 Tax=Roseomonas xinghualingensis TaxID=2986475 RepID=UPI0021F0FF6A|nr:hypothetical protein [Roseomonas sp. SXEYE001]MCV4209879.1 hypothetical protein [Roseomonas sp. SXEYE001]